MNIDERLEALTQSIELLSLMHKDHESQFEDHKRRISAVIESLAISQQELVESNRQQAERNRQQSETNRQQSETNRQQAETNRQLAVIAAGLREGQQDLREAVMRLSVIAEAHQDTLDDHGERLKRN